MKTKNNTPALGFDITAIRGTEKMTVKVRLSDPCGNGHCDFSVTADIYEKTLREGWRESGGGCCHSEVLASWPELKPFVALHLSDQFGVPTHAMANAIYWLAGAIGREERYGPDQSPEECRRILADHLRLTPEELADVMAAAPHTADELQYWLEERGITDRWKQEALAAIAELESRTGEQWPADYVPTRVCLMPLTEEIKVGIREKVESGYYTPEAVAERERERQEAKAAAELAAIHADYAEAVGKAETVRNVKLEMNRLGMTGKNWIHYTHSNSVAVNWTSTGKLITKDEFDAMTARAEMGALPEGFKFEWAERPKY